MAKPGQEKQVSTGTYCKSPGLGLGDVGACPISVCNQHDVKQVILILNDKYKNAYLFKLLISIENRKKGKDSILLIYQVLLQIS